MTVEQRVELEEPSYQFPVGMRVLVVDDDPTCLLILERVLRKCRYHVTTRTNAIAALNLLRENNNRFDLVIIGDVHMPDMDGFKLLELVGLEMDLPVIMLSANGDPKLVMKAITHGACDYLLKPVRIEELQNIWQHVVSKKKVDPNDDPSAQIWSLELHRKFVAAVNHLGIDKAVPKRILELMNVEKLTRENVASHLQKYRLYLRRISCVQSQQAITLNGMGGSFGQLSGAPQFQDAAFRSFQPNGMLGRLNSPADLGIQRLPSNVQSVSAMTVEQRVELEELSDQFPVGMRVLAVDDDPTCLLLLERLLRKCKYHVTTSTNAIDALNLLRETNNKFDLVISEVHMPDMDGFKLLELVGHEMDLPVIMLSANGDPKLVMKGITHGACDYLLKPVRIVELQNIWQHVVRKKKVDPKDQKASDNYQNGCNEGGQGGGGNANADQKSSKKRKDQVEDEDEDHDENGIENDDPSAQKKPRVVWSVELHCKFVAAVNHLGVDKAVPERILELMNVEKLTRENVASHLQKYRLYLRRISCVQSQPAITLNVNGMGGSFGQLSGAPQFQDAAFRSFQPNGMLGRLNSPADLGIQRLPSTVQVNNSLFSGNPSKGMPMSFDFNQLQDSSNRSVSHVVEIPTKVNDLTHFSVSPGLPDAKPSIGSLNSSHFAPTNNSLMGKATTILKVHLIAWVMVVNVVILLTCMKWLCP